MSLAEATVQATEKPEVWSEWQLETAIRMWTDSQSSTEIAKVIGRTRNAVIGRMHRIGCVRGKGIVDYAPKYYPAQSGSTPSPEPAPPPVPTPPPIEIPEPEPQEPPQPLHSLDAMFTQAQEVAVETPVESPQEPVQAAPAPRVLPVIANPDREPLTFPEQTELPNGLGKTPRPMKNLLDAPPEEGIPLLTVSGPRCRYPMWSDMSTLPIEKKNVCGHPTISGSSGSPTSWCEKHFKIVYEPPRPRR